MKVTQFTGVAEKKGILVTKGCQIIALTNDGADFANEEIEISLVDFTTGKETVLMRKALILLYAEVCAQGGNIRQQHTALIEVSDGRDLELNANRVLRINLTSLTGADTYHIHAIESGVPAGLPVIYEQLITANGVKLQKFPIMDGSLLVLPISDLEDIRIVYNDNTECRLDRVELAKKAVATNGIIEISTAHVPTAVGSKSIFIVDLNLQLPTGQTKRVIEVEVNLQAGLGYTMYKIVNMENAGFDWKF